LERLNATFQLSPRLLRLRDVKGVPVAFEFSEDSARLAITLRDGRKLDWDLPHNEIGAGGTTTSPPPRNMLASPDGQWELQVVRNGVAVELNNALAGTNVTTLPVSGPLYDMNFSPDSATFALAVFRDQAGVYESATG